MKKFSLLIFCFSIVVLYTSLAQAQVIKLGISGGLTSITSPSPYTNSVSDNGKGFGGNFNFGAQARIDVPLLPLTPIVFIDYHMLRGDGTRNNVDIKTSQNILSIGVQAEYTILPLPLVKPYVSVEAAYNNLGDLKEGSTTVLGSVTRFGGAIGVGAVITVLPIVDLDVSLKYNFFNLIGKNSNEESINAISLNLAVIF